MGHNSKYIDKVEKLVEFYQFPSDAPSNVFAEGYSLAFFVAKYLAELTAGEDVTSISNNITTSLKELEDFAERLQLLVIKDGDKLCGFLIAEIIGVSWYLRYWYTSQDYRNQGIGAKLLKTSLLMAGETKRQMFWVISDNDNAIKRYEHYGFKRENMNDYVLIKKI